jgi:hypothetical protein
MRMHTCNTSIREAEAGGLSSRLTWLHTRPLTQKERTENLLRDSKENVHQARPVGGLMLLEMVCSVRRVPTGQWKSNGTVSQRGHCLGSAESRSLSAAATRGPFTARNQKRYQDSSLFRGTDYPMVCPQAF